MKESYPGREVGVVFGVLQDKDVESMLSVLEVEASRVVFTRAQNEHATAPARLVEEFGGSGVYEENAVEALGSMVGEMKKKRGVVLVSGSLYAGVSIIRWLREA
jgi:folylpolyglutamate synthase/dihydropteroate synthase